MLQLFSNYELEPLKVFNQILHFSVSFWEVANIFSKLDLFYQKLQSLFKSCSHISKVVVVFV